jgi:uncharacterized membrane protein
MTFLAIVAIGMILAVPVTLFVFAGKFRQLEWRIWQLEDQLRKLKAETPPQASISISGVAPSPASSQPSPVERSATPPPPPVARPAQPIPSKPIDIPPTLHPEPASRTQQEWEALVGGKLLNRIGALALIIGVGFFLKYAFDNNWISETLRVLIGAVAGGGLLLLGGLSHKKGLAVFSQGILGAGVAILYLSVYASFNFYHLVSQPFAFGLMAVVTGVAFWQGLRYNSLAIALLGWTGGFMTPFLLNTGHPNAIGLFTYLAILDIGVLAIVAFRRDWTVFHSLSLVATYLIYFAWSGEYGDTLSRSTTMLFLTVWLLAFHISELFGQLRPGKLIDLLRIAAGANLLMFALAARLLFDQPEDETISALIMLAIAAFCTVTYWQLERNSQSTPVFRYQYLVSALVFVAVATLDLFDGYHLVIAWSLESLAIFIWGAVKEHRPVWMSGLALMLLAGIAMIAEPNTFRWEEVADFVLIFNQRVLAMLVFAACLAMAAPLAARKLHDESSSAIAGILTVGWTVTLFLLLTVETIDYFQKQIYLETGAETVSPAYLRGLILSVIWALYSLPLIWLGVRRKSETLAIVGLISVGLAAFMALLQGLSYQPIEHFRLFLNVRFATFILIVASLLIGARLLTMWESAVDYIRTMVSGLYLAALAVLLFLFTAETWNGFDRLKEAALHSTTELDQLSRLADLQQLSLSGVWLVFSIVLMVLGIWKRARILRVVAMVLFGITILKIFIYDLSFLETLYRIFSFIGLGVILLAVSYLYQRYKSIILDEHKNPEEKPVGN